MLEVGCGAGELALALARAGYSVTALDPEAPEGPIFRRVPLESFSDDHRFDAVVASVSLHHVESPSAAFDQIERLLRPGGLLIVEEFARERFRGATARWYYERRRALAAAQPDYEPVEDDFEAWLRRWEVEHADIHPFAEMRCELDARFRQRSLSWEPYLYDYLLTDELEPLERELIRSGAIEATGVRYVGDGRRADERPG